jgi:membrane protein YqaA with SNARE-associated domain
MAMLGILGGVFGLMLGAIVAWLLGTYYNAILMRQIREGHLILWVRTPGREEEQIACGIMKKHGGRRVHVHDIH